MADFALDPALFGVAGPSTSAAGRVRDIPKGQQLAAGQSGSSEEETGSSESSSESVSGSDDEEEEEEEGSDSEEDGDESSAAGSQDAPVKTKASQAQKLPPLPDRSFTALQKGKGRAQPVGNRGFETDDGLETGAETDYQTDTGTGRAGELNRLISAIRETTVTADPTTVSNRGVLGTEWDRTIQQEMEDLENEDARHHGGRRGKKGGGGRGRVAMADMEPSREVKDMLGRANLAYALGNLKEAINIYTEIIRIEPSTKKAWLGLSGVHKELGNMDKEIQCQIVATQLSRSHPDDWKHLASQSRDLGLLEQAVYCYSQAIKADRKDVDAIWDRADLLRETGKHRQAIQGFTAILKIQPHSPAVLRELGPLYYQLNDVPSGISLFAAAFEHFRTVCRVPRNSDDVQGFGNSDLELYSDFVRSQRRYREAAKIIVDGSRWLQGRIDEEATWANFADDREYDLQRKTRPNWQDHPQRWCEDAPIHPLETGLRLRLGLCRLAEGKAEEAKIHFDVIRQGDVLDNPEFYGEIADAYFDKKLWADALEVFYDMSENDSTNVPAVWIKIAQCQRHLGDIESAVQCYQAVVDSEPNDLDSRLALAELYERMNEREKALELVNNVLDQRRRNKATGTGDDHQSASEYEDSGSGSTTGGDEAMSEGDPDANGTTRRGRKSRSKRAKRLRKAGKRRPLTLEERLEEDRQTQETFDATLLKMREVDRLMEEQGIGYGDSESPLVYEWLDLVAFLVNSFRTTKALFPSDGKKKFAGIFQIQKKRNKGGSQDVEEQANDIANRLQATMADDERPNNEPDANVEQNAYRGVSFDDWAKIAVRYAFMLTCIDERAEAENVIRHLITSSSMRQDGPRLQFLIFGLTACFMHGDNYDVALDEMRKLITSRRWESEPLRFMMSVCNSGLPALDAFVSTKFQKYLLRQVKYIDTKALPSTGVDDENDSAEEGDAGLHADNILFKPTKVNPLFLMLYGHIMACGKSYQSAIVYYLRAYDLRQDDPLICLSLALAYVHRAMQRQTDNRHYQIAQAIAFLDGYRKHRGNEEEVQYNIARVFQQLGVLDLAVKHYEKVLERADERMQKEGMQVDNQLDLSKEAAYNLSTIYFTRNAPDLARNVVDKYLRL